MAVTTERQYRQTLTLSMAYRQKEIQDLVFSSNPVSAILRENGMFKTFTGPEITVPLGIDKYEVQWFTGFDPLRNAPKEIVNQAVFTPKNVAVGSSRSGTELRANEGGTKVIDLVDLDMNTMRDSMRDGWEISFHGSGTGSNGREMIGFGGAIPIVPGAGVYGGIDRSLHPIYQTSTFTATTDFASLGYAGWDSTSARGILENIVSRRSKGGRYAKIAIADLASFQVLSASMVAHQRIVVESVSDTRQGVGVGGPRPLRVPTPVGNIDVYCATGVGSVMPANTIYGIDPDALEVRYMADYNMVPLFPGDGARPVNQDAYAQYLLWVGEMVLRNPRYTWRLIATPTPA